METTKKSVSKGNKTTEIIVGAAVAKLTGAIVSLNTVVAEVGKLEQKASDGILKVSDLEDKIGGLEQDLKNKTAQSKIELEQAYNSNKENFVGQYLAEKKLTAVDSMEYGQLQVKLEEATKNVADTVKAEVGKAVGIEQNNSKNALAIQKLEFEKVQAQSTAQLSQSASQITFLEAQVKMWKDALDAERAAGVERAKASSIGTLNVGQPGR